MPDIAKCGQIRTDTAKYAQVRPETANHDQMVQPGLYQNTSGAPDLTWPGFGLDFSPAFYGNLRRTSASVSISDQTSQTWWRSEINSPRLCRSQTRDLGRSGGFDQRAQCLRLNGLCTAPSTTRKQQDALICRDYRDCRDC